MKIRALITTLALVLGLSASVSFGQSQVADPDALSSGEVAKRLAIRLGLNLGQTALTGEKAIQLLQARGIEPSGGWDAGAPLEASEFARVLGQALGLDEEFTDTEKADNQAYVEALVEDYGLDVVETAQANEILRINRAAQLLELTKIESDETIEFIDSEDFDAIIDSLIPTNNQGEIVITDENGDDTTISVSPSGALNG